jgi:hypothetical protein
MSYNVVNYRRTSNLSLEFSIKPTRFCLEFSQNSCYFWVGKNGNPVHTQPPFGMGVRTSLENFGRYGDIDVCPLYAIGNVVRG